MTEKSPLDQDIRQLEARKLQSEIDRNVAERDELISRSKGWWKPYLVGLSVLLVMLAAFGDFFSNLYQIALVDKEALKAANDKLLKANSTLEVQARHAAQSAAAASAQITSTTPKGSITEATLHGAVLVTRWGPTLREVHAVLLDPITKIAPEATFAHGAQLGIDKPTSDLGLVGGQDWSGKWTLRDDKIRISETYPRPFDKGITIEIELAKRATNGRFPATRTRGAFVEPGIGEILLKGADRIDAQPIIPPDAAR